MYVSFGTRVGLFLHKSRPLLTRAHVDQVFEDCSVPPSIIVDSFLRLAEGLKPGAVIMAFHPLTLNSNP